MKLSRNIWLDLEGLFSYLVLRKLLAGVAERMLALFVPPAGPGLVPITGGLRRDVAQSYNRL